MTSEKTSSIEGIERISKIFPLIWEKQSFNPIRNVRAYSVWNVQSEVVPLHNHIDEPRDIPQAMEEIKEKIHILLFIWESEYHCNEIQLIYKNLRCN